jgi:hypothetical protein
MNREQQEQQDEARRLRAMALLWTLLEQARKLDEITWRELGGFDAQDLLDALEMGKDHPVLKKWRALKAGAAANRPAPSASELGARRLVVLAAVALKRAGLGKQAARERLADALARNSKQIGFPAASPAASPEAIQPASPGAIRHWQRDLEPPLSPQDEAVIETALKRCGNDPGQLIRHFLGLVEYARKPLPAGARWR